MSKPKKKKRIHRLLKQMTVKKMLLAQMILAKK